MEKAIIAKKKFAIGGVFALLSALTVFLFMAFDVIKNVVRFSLAESIPNLTVNVQWLFFILSYIQGGLLVLSFLVLAILLFAKVRGPLLLAFPVLQALALLCGLISQVVTLVESRSYLNFLTVLSNLMTTFTGVLLFAGNLLFAVVVLVNSKKSKKLTAFAYITPVAFFAGYGLRTLTEAVFYLLNLYYFLTDYEMYEEHGLSLYMFINYVLNFNTIALLLYTILFTLTVFFACKWIVNPYKKETALAEEEPDEEALAEPCEEA